MLKISWLLKTGSRFCHQGFFYRFETRGFKIAFNRSRIRYWMVTRYWIVIFESWPESCFLFIFFQKNKIYAFFAWSNSSIDTKFSRNVSSIVPVFYSWKSKIVNWVIYNPSRIFLEPSREPLLGAWTQFVPSVLRSIDFVFWLLL